MYFDKKKNFLSKKTKNNFFSISKTTLYNTLFVVNQIIDDDFGRNIVEFANYLVKNNVGVLIFTKKIDIKILLNTNIVVIESLFCGNNLFFSKKIISICNDFNINAIQICSPEFFKKIILNKKKINALIVSELYNTLDISKRWNFFYFKYIIKSDLIITFSDYVNNFLLNNFNFNYNNIHTFNICVDDELFNVNNVSLGRLKNIMQKEIGMIPDNCKIFYCNCDFSNISFFDKILKAIKLINRKDFIFIFSGSFDNNQKQINDLIYIIKDFDLMENVKIVKPILDRPAIYMLSYAIIHVQKSNNSFTKTFCEAGFMKKPIIEICTDIISNNVIDGKTGFLVKKNNVFDIKNAISKVIDLNDKEYNDMCENAYNYTIKYFKKTIIFRDMNNLIYNSIKEKIELSNKKKMERFLF